MAQKGVQLDRETFSCSICLDLLKDPVTIPCGHSYCINCITNFWDGDEKKIHSCPQCRQAFTPRPDLVKNTMLADLVEQLKKTGLQAAPADHCYAGPEDVACDFCTGRKLKAVKSCLMCLVSYCETHVQPHFNSPAFQKHKLVEPSKKLQENICSRHDEVMKLFCRTDQECICYLCSVDQHKGHNTVSAVAERTERQRELEGSRQKLQQRIQHREKDVKVLQQEVEAINRSADKTVEESEKMFTELIRLLEKRRADAKQQIRSQQETEASRVKELQEKLEQEITELKRKDAELEQLSHTEDHNQFLLNYPSVSCLSESANGPSVNLQSKQYFQEVTAAVSRGANQLKAVLKDDWTKDPKKTDKQGQKSTAMQTAGQEQMAISRHDFMKCACEIFLNPITANPFVSLSNNNRKATLMGGMLSPLRLHPEQFVKWWQVLSMNGLKGRSYWEVKLNGKVLIAVAYKDICRIGTRNECGFGHNNKSWALECSTSGYTFRHNNISTPVTGPVSSRIGVFLDHRAGILSFYSLTLVMTHLITFKAKFTQPLYPGFWLPECAGDSVEICELR